MPCEPRGMVINPLVEVYIPIKSWTNIDRPKTHPNFNIDRYQICRSQSMLFLFLGGGFRYFLFSSLLGEDAPILTVIFFK